MPFSRRRAPNWSENCSPIGVCRRASRAHRDRLDAPAGAATLLFGLFALCLGNAACSRPAETSAAQAPPPFEYVDAWGTHGDGPGQLSSPVAIATDGESIIYIADATSGYIHKFSASGEPRLSFQDDRMDLHPADIAVDAGAAIFVADSRKAAVVIFFSDGMHHRALRGGLLSGARGSMHIGVDAYGTLYVTGKRPFGVRRFNPGLRWLGSWGGGSNSVIENPSTLAVGPDGLLYVGESERPQIEVFDPHGALERTLSTPPDAGEVQLSGVAVNAKYVFAVGRTEPSIFIWALDGTYRLRQDLSPWIPSDGSAVARKVVVTPAGDLLVLDPAATRIFRFHVHL
jgi:hypothetical protein